MKPIVREVQKEEFEEFANLVRLGWPEARGRLDVFDCYPIACFLEDKMVSGLILFKRQMRLGTCFLQLGGIGAVITHPEYRRRGFSTACLKYAIRKMEKEGYDISALGTGIPEFYARLGWVSFPYPGMQFRLRCNPESLKPDPKYRVDRFDPLRDLDEVMQLYDTFNYARTGTLLRTKKYWLEFFEGPTRWFTEDPNAFFVARREEKIVAYIRSDPWHYNLTELAYYPEDKDALRNLLAAWLVYISDRGRQTAQGYLFPELAGLWEEVVPEFERFERGGTMIRLINLKSLFYKILPELQRRLSNSSLDLEIKIVIECQNQKVSLRIKDRRIEIVPNFRLSTFSPHLSLYLSFEPQKFFRLILGQSSVAELQLDKEFGLSDKASQVLNTLFPKTGFTFWGPDGI